MPTHPVRDLKCKKLTAIGHGVKSTGKGQTKYGAYTDESIWKSIGVQRCYAVTGPDTGSLV